MENAAENCVDISVITDQYQLEGFQAEMLESSNGTHIVSYYTIADEVYEHVFDDIYVEKEQLPVILATGYQKVILDSKLYPNGYWGGVGTDADTDRDGLTDWDEVKTELLTISSIGKYELPTVEHCLEELEYIPFYVQNAFSLSDVRRMYWDCEVLPITSDPMNIDGDFDGVADKTDDSPLNNFFVDTLHTSDGDYSVYYTMDYSAFFKDNSQFSESLCTISSLYAALAYKDTALSTPDSTPDDYYADELMRKHGMITEGNVEGYTTNTIHIGDGTDQHVTDVIIGHRDITYFDEKKTIVLVAIRGTGASIFDKENESLYAEWSSNFDIGSEDIYTDQGIIPRNEDWIIMENHMGLDVTATRIIDVVNQYIEANDIDTDQAALWLTGHSRGGGLSNIVGARVGYTQIDSINNYKNEYISDTYVYTFASPRTTVITEEEAVAYDYIFNIINGDDIVPQLPLLEPWGFRHYGKDIEISVEANCFQEWNRIAGDGEEYTCDVYEMKQLLDTFSLLAENRNDCYIYHCECKEHNGDGLKPKTSFVNPSSYVIEYGAPYRITTKGTILYRHCQTTAYFMQYLSCLAASSGTGNYIFNTKVTSDSVSRLVCGWAVDLAYAYKGIYIQFTSYAAQNMAEPHMPISYCILSHYAGKWI